MGSMFTQVTETRTIAVPIVKSNSAEPQELMGRIRKARRSLAESCMYLPSLALQCSDFIDEEGHGVYIVQHQDRINRLKSVIDELDAICVEVGRQADDPRNRGFTHRRLS